MSGFVLALLGVSPVGLGLSIAALKQTISGRRAGHGLAIAGTILGGLGMLVWAALFGMMLVAVTANSGF